MSVNNVTFQQSSAILNALVGQATGKTAVISTEGDFVSVAQTALNLPKDAVVNAISSVIARTIFVNRIYNPKMKGLQKDLPTWGAYMRKLAVVESEWDDSKAHKYPVTFDATESANPMGNGGSVDPWTIKKREIQQTNFLGQSVFQDHYTLFKNQFFPTFRSSQEFGEFVAMIATNMKNKITVAKENISRYLVSNFGAGMIAENNTSRVVKLLTLYNNELGLTGNDAFTATSIMHPDNYPAFIKWAYAKIASIASLMTEYSKLYQTTINNKPVMKATPYEKQKVYILGGDKFAIESRVLADTFHDSYLNKADAEIINFWQGIEEPDKISITPTYTSTSGEVVTSQSAITKTGVFAILFDEDALGWAPLFEDVDPSPYNSAGKYWNLWYSFDIRTFTDFTEKGVIFLLE